MLKEPSTPSAVFNSKIRGKKIELTENDTKLISNALSLIWSKTNKKVDICRFEKDMATVTYLKNEGRLYFDLLDQESQDTENLQKKLEKHKKNESHYLYLYEHYKRKCESLENELHELQKAAIGDMTMDTVVSDEIISDDGINELIDELSRDNIRPPESSTTPPPTLYSESTTPGSIFYPKRDSEFARLVNCDLAMNDLATSNSPDDIWANLNKRCIQKFGENNHIKDNASVEDVTWACITLPAYLSWNLMGKYHDEINSWIIKINTFSSTPPTTTSSDPSQGPPTTNSSDPLQGSPTDLLQGPSTDPSQEPSTDPSQEPSTMTSSDPPQEPSIATSSDPLQKPPIAISSYPLQGLLRLPSSYQKSTSQEPSRHPPLYQKPLLQGPSRPPSSYQKLPSLEPSRPPPLYQKPLLQGPSRPPSSYQKLPSQEPLIAIPLTTTSSLSASSSIKLRKRKGEHSEGAAFKKSHTEGDIFLENEADDLNLEEFLVQSHDNSLNPAQMLLLNKGKKLREILIESSDNAHELIISKDSNIKIMDTLTELSAEPIKIIDEKSAAKRIQQWKNQEKQCSEFLIAAESYNLYHLMSFVQVYEDLLRIGEILKKDPKNNIKNVKSWVIKFVCDNLKINQKMEQRQRLGCDRLRSLFNEGITCDQLSRAGLKKCDFFTSQSYYEIFISQIPPIETRHSISLSSTESYLSEVTSAEACKKKKNESVVFRLLLGEKFNDLKDKYKDDEYIVID